MGGLNFKNMTYPNYSTDKVNKILISKPKGKEIRASEISLLQKKFYMGFSYVYSENLDADDPQIIYVSDFKKANDLKEENIVFSDKVDSLICCCDSHPDGKDGGVFYSKSTQEQEWFLFAAAGDHKWVSSGFQSPSASKIIYDKFISKMSKVSRYNFIKEICDLYPQESYALIDPRDKKFKLLGANNVKVNGIAYSNADHLFDLTFERKTFIKQVLLYFSNKNDAVDITKEKVRIGLLNNRKLLEEAEKIPNLVSLSEKV